MPPIAVVALGGTIDNQRPDPGTGGSRPGHQVEHLVASLVERGLAPDARVERWGSRGGATLGPADFVDVARHLTELDRSAAYGGYVVTTGTDTLEECAYALTLLTALARPVVVTGSMKRVGDPGSDADGNLASAIQAAGDPGVAAIAPAVVFGDEVVSAVVATKEESTLTRTFVAELGARHGVMSEGRFYSCLPDPRAHHVGMPLGELPEVDLLWVGAGTGPEQALASAERGRGVVVAGTGGGHVTPAMMAGIEALRARDLPVVVASRCRQGPTLTETYGGPSSEIALAALGAVSAGMITPLKARLRLVYGMAAGREATDLFPVDAAGPLAR